MTTSQRILIFGGSFDPPHRAHTELARCAAQKLDCDRIIFIPASINPRKSETPPTNAAHRLAMLDLVVRTIPGAGAEVSTIELDRAGPSYFIDTLNELRAGLGDEVELHFLVGADQALTFDQWKDWQRILELAEPAVVLRPPHDRASFEQAVNAKWGETEGKPWLDGIITAPLMDISATTIRTRLAAGDSVDDLLDPAVAHYIATEHLYR